jgi:hypothetical protein
VIHALLGAIAVLPYNVADARATAGLPESAEELAPTRERWIQ